MRTPQPTAAQMRQRKIFELAGRIPGESTEAAQDAAALLLRRVTRYNNAAERVLIFENDGEQYRRNPAQWERNRAEMDEHAERLYNKLQASAAAFGLIADRSGGVFVTLIDSKMGATVLYC
jgi:hypothetical protein